MTSLAEQFFGIPTGNICDSNDLVGNISVDLKPLSYRYKLAGEAVTVSCVPGDNLPIHYAIASAKPGSVLVIDCQGYVGAGVFGEVMAHMCVAKGIRGVIINGACRDKESLIDMNFPVFSVGVNPNGTVKEYKGTINEEILFLGTRIRPGDIIVGDSDGVVVVEQEKAALVYEKAKNKQQKEECEIIPRVDNGETTLKILGLG